MSRVFQHNEIDIGRDGSVALYQCPKRDGSGEPNPIFQLQLKVPTQNQAIPALCFTRVNERSEP